MGDFSIKALLGIDSTDADSKLNKTGNKFTKLGGLAAAAGVAAAAAIAAAAVAFLKFAVDATKAFMQFEKGMAEVFTLLPGHSAEAKDKMKADILELGAAFGFLTEDTVPALYQALSAGVPEDNVMTFLEGAAKLSIAGVATLTESVALLSQVTNAYGEDAGTTEHQAAILFSTVKNGTTTIAELSASLGDVMPIASAAGVSFDETAAAMAALTGVTGNTSKAATQLKAALAELSKPGSQAAMAFEEAMKGSEFMGMSFIEANDKGLTLKDALKAMDEMAVKNGTSFFEMFGSVEAASGAMALATDDFAALTAASKDQSNALSDLNNATEEMRGTWDFEVKQMQARWEKFMLMFGEMMGPILEAIGPIIDALLTMLESLPWEEFEEEVAALGEAIKESFGSKESKEAMSFWLTMLFDGIILVIRMVGALMKFGAALTKLGIWKLFVIPLKAAMAVLEFFTNMLSAAGDILAGTSSGLKALAKQFGLSDEAAEAFANSVLKYTQWIRDAITFVGDTIRDVLGWFKNEFVGTVRAEMGGLVSYIRKDGDSIGAIAENTAKGVLAMVTGTISKIISAVYAGWEFIYGGIRDLVDWLFGKAEEAGEGIYNILPDWAQRAVDRVWEFISGLYDKVMGVLDEIWGWLETHFPWLTNLIEGAMDMAGAAFDWVYDKAMALFGMLKEWYDTIMGWFDDIDSRAADVAAELEAEKKAEEEAEAEKKRLEEEEEKAKEDAKKEEKEKAKARREEIDDKRKAAVEKGRREKRERESDKAKEKKAAKKTKAAKAPKRAARPKDLFKAPPGIKDIDFKPVTTGPGGGRRDGDGRGIGGGAGGIGRECCKEISDNVGITDEEPGKGEGDEELELSNDCVAICDEPNGIKIRTDKPMPVWIMGGEKPINVIITGQDQFLKVDLWGVAAPVPVFIMGGMAPVRVILEENFQLTALLASQILIGDLLIQLAEIMAGKKLTPGNDCACLRLTEISYSTSVTAMTMIELLGHTKKIDNNIAAIRKRIEGCITNQ